MNEPSDGFIYFICGVALTGCVIAVLFGLFCNGSIESCLFYP